MVFRGQIDGVEAAVSLKNTSVSLALGTGHVIAWDLGGRIYSVFKGGHTFRRGLSGRVLHKWRDPEASPGAAGPYDERQRVVLSREESDLLLDEAAAAARRALDAVAGNGSAWRDAGGRSPGAAVTDALASSAGFDAAVATRDAARFAQVYSPIGILPPDQYMSVVLQATSGCSFGTCTFCDLYHEAYRVKAPAEFARHIQEVRRFLGRSLSLRGQSVFLGAANALAVPMPRLVELLGVVRDAFAADPRPVHAFVDGFTGTLKDPRAYRELAALGLKRVYIGLESGHDALLAFVRKPGTSLQAVETVRAIKAAGVAVGVIVMVGLGGHRFAGGHVADTIVRLNQMALGTGDLLYFSDLVEVPGTAYPEIANEVALRPLSLAERIEQLRAIRSGLEFPGAPPKFARYDIREFIY